MARMCGNAYEVRNLTTLLNCNVVACLNKIVMSDMDIVSNLQVFRMINEGGVADPCSNQ